MNTTAVFGHWWDGRSHYIHTKVGNIVSFSRYTISNTVFLDKSLSYNTSIPLVSSHATLGKFIKKSADVVYLTSQQLIEDSMHAIQIRPD